MGMTVPALQYLGRILWKIPGSWKRKKQVLSCLATPVRDYAERNPNGGYDAIVHRFGEPNEVVQSYLADMEIEDLSKHLQFKNKIVTIVGASALVIVLLWVGVVCIALAEARSNVNYTIVDDIEVNERSQINEGGNE